MGGEDSPGDILTPTRVLTVSLGWDAPVQLYSCREAESWAQLVITCPRVSPATKLCAPRGQSAVIFISVAPALGTAPLHTDRAKQTCVE